MKKPLCGFLVLVSASAAPSARASSFDSQGELRFDPGALYIQGFETGAAPTGGAIVADPSSIQGASLLRIPASGAATLSIPIPRPDLSVSISLYTRGGGALFELSAAYSGRGVPYSTAFLYPTGRVTSDGWLEMRSAPISLPFHRATSLSLLIYNSSGQDADVDGVEIVTEGEFRDARTCSPPDASRCAEGDVCAMGYCIQGAPYVPPIPEGADRVRLPESIAADLYGNFGGIATRAHGLPEALAALRAMPAATNATEYWSGLTAAIQLLHDSHSIPSVGFFANDTVPICFVQGDADLSHRRAPSDPRYPDVLVSHGLPGRMAGLVPGDRLVAINGVHPIEFARSLVGLSSSNTQSSDPTEYEQNIESVSYDLRQWATNITVIHCDPATKECGAPHTIPVSSLPTVPFGEAPVCDNRPAYHLASGNPDPVTHNTNNDVYYGRLAGTTTGEALFGMIFDSLSPNPGPDPYQGPLADIRQEAQGVLIDRRTGNGGGFQYASEVSAPFFTTSALTVTWGPEPYYWDRLWTQADGLSEFDQVVSVNPFVVGSSSPKPGLKAAVLVSRDVSADDFFAYGLRGGVNVRSFGTKSCGAFSQILTFPYAGSAVWFSMGNGESFTPDGTSLDGTGAEPDERVVPTQSDLLAGRDTAYERALAWLRCTACDTKGGK